MAEAKEKPPLERRMVDHLVGEQGTGAAQIASDGSVDADVRDFVSTQCASLDYAIGRHGIPVGRLTTMAGAEATGKSTVLHHILAETQRRGGVAVLIEAEHRYSRDRGERLGIDHDRLVYVPGYHLEQVFESMKELASVVRDEAPDQLVTIGLDSLDMTPTKSQLEGKYGVGDHARLVSRELREIHGLAAKHRIALVIVSQFRANIQTGPSWYGNPDTVIANGSLRYYASLRIKFRQVQKLPKPDNPTGILVEAECYKNTVAPPFKRARFLIDFLQGIDRTAAKLEVAKTIGLVRADGTWLKADGYPKAFHPPDFAEVLAEVPSMEEEIANAPTRWLNGGSPT